MELNDDARSEKYRSACSLASTLIETTNKLFKTQATLQTYIDNSSTAQIVSELHALVHVFELVNMIAKVVKSIRPFLDDDKQKQSFATAADLALSKSYTGILKFYNLLTNHPNLEINELVNDRLFNLIKMTEKANPSLIQPQSTFVAPKPEPIQVEQSPPPQPMQVDPPQTPAPVPPPVQQPAPVQRPVPVQQPIPVQQQKRTPLQQQQPVRIDPPKRDNSVNKPEANKRLAPQSQPQPNGGSISTTKFMEGFEKTMLDFAAKTGYAIDSFWENMFLIAAPANRLDWVKENLLNKKLSWRDARRIYFKEFPDPEPTPIAPPTPARTVTKNRRGGPDNTNIIYIPPSNIRSSRQREAQYAESLLSLEMKAHDDINAYNDKFLRYCRAANMTLTDQSLQRRYLSSLLPKHRQLITNTMKQPVQGLEALMKVASGVIRTAEGPMMGRVKPYSRSCAHSHQQQNNYPLKRSYPYADTGSSSKRTAP